MATFEVNGQSFYMDNRLKREIDEKIAPQLQKRDKDAVYIVDGRERSGKSVFAQTLAANFVANFGTKFDISNICLNPTEFRNRIENAKKNEVIIYDEAHRGMGSTSALSEVNKILTDLMMEMGQRNLCVIIVLPTFFLLGKYTALFRARGLFHVYERKKKRGFWVFFNEKNKLRLYMKGKKELNYNSVKWAGFRGRFFNQYLVDEEKYREKKSHSFKAKKRITKDESLIHQRDLMMYILSKELNKNPYQVNKLLEKYNFPLTYARIMQIFRENKEEFQIELGESNKMKLEETQKEETDSKPSKEPEIEVITP